MEFCILYARAAKIIIKPGTPLMEMGHLRFVKTKRITCELHAIICAW